MTSFPKRSVLVAGLAALLSLLIGFASGIYTAKSEVFPYSLLTGIKSAFDDLRENWEMYLRIRPIGHLALTQHQGQGVLVDKGPAVQPGLTLVSGLFDDAGSSVRLMDHDGKFVYRWDVRYSRIWPDPQHLKAAPFNDWFLDIHGLALLPDYSIVFNYEFLGLNRLDACGNVMWKIPQETHHAIFVADDNTLWVPSRHLHTERSPDFPNLVPPFYEDTLLQVSLDGKILREISVLGLLYKNGLEGLLPTGDKSNQIEQIDPLHLNDVEVLSRDLAPAYPTLKAGVVMVSMRHQNLIVIFDPATEKVLWHQTGPWMKQHDADFRQDGLISVFDNRGSSDGDAKLFGGSRILLIDPVSRQVSEAFPRQAGNQFFTSVRGRQQLLANGDTLLLESTGGRILEVDPRGDVTWSYLNRYDKDNVGKLQEATRIPDGYLAQTPPTCQGTAQSSGP